MGSTTAENAVPSNGKFNLPSLGPLGSLTAGTNIPPPLDSPIEETPARIAAVQTTTATNDEKEAANPPRTTTVTNHHGHADGEAPTSPVSRQGSIRRLFSLRSMNSTFMEGERPDSSATLGGTPGSTASGTKAKKSSWWRKRKMVEADLSREQEKEKMARERKGPPPPTLPKLESFGIGKETTAIGGEELFRDIK